VAEPQTSTGLARLLSDAVSPSTEVVFFRNERGSDLPVKAAEKQGATVKVLHAYRMISTTPPGMDSYRKQWDENGLDAVVFGSGALVEAWKEIIGDLPGKTIPVAWGQPCGETVRKVLKREPVIMAEPDLEGMVSTLKKIRKSWEVHR
jgi:uroporphyrinogen III methyltransferase/synthase